MAFKPVKKCDKCGEILHLTIKGPADSGDIRPLSDPSLWERVCNNGHRENI